MATTAPVSKTETKTDAETAVGLSDVALTKYKDAQAITDKVLDLVLGLCKAGANLAEICIEGDKAIEQGCAPVYNKPKAVPKGIAFPTCISLNNTVSHFSPAPSDTDATAIVLAEGDVCKIELGAHIDGYASICAETIVVPAAADASAASTEAEKAAAVTGRKADVIKAAYEASEAAIRLMRPGNKNKQVTDAIATIAKSYGCAPIDAQYSCSMGQNVLVGDKKVLLSGHTSGADLCTFEAGQVWGIDVLLTTSDGKGVSREASSGLCHLTHFPQCQKKDTRTTVFKKTDHTYQLKLAAARKVYSEVVKKAGAYPFTVRMLEDEKKGRFGLSECEKNGLLTPFDVLYDKSGEHVAQFFFTVYIGPKSNTRLSSGPVWMPKNSATVQSEKSVTDESLVSLLKTSLKVTKKKTTKTTESAKPADA